MREQEVRNLWEAYLEVCENQQIDEVSDEVISRTSHKRMQNLSKAQKKEMGARDAGATMGEISQRADETSDAAAKVSKNRRLATAHARSRKRMNKEEVETWVNSLIEEGYDLSDYTWEEMYEAYENLNEAEIMKHQKERGAIERRKKMKGYEPPTKGVHGEIERRQTKKPPSKLRSGSLPESYDLFDVILEHLVDEGYADTNKSALAIMANMSEEWREEILDEAITSEKGKAKAAEMIAARSTPSGRAKSGKGANVAQIRKIGRSNREGLGGTPMTPTMAKNPVKKKNYDGTGNKAARRAGTYSRFGYKDPSNK
jgi:hypothetical protein